MGAVRLTIAKPKPRPQMRRRLAVELNYDSSYVFITYFDITFSLCSIMLPTTITQQSTDCKAGTLN